MWEWVRFAKKYPDEIAIAPQAIHRSIPTQNETVLEAFISFVASGRSSNDPIAIGIVHQMSMNHDRSDFIFMISVLIY